MDLDDLRVFLAIHRGGTVSSASTALGVSRSTVNRRLDALEGAAGLQLVERTPDGLSLTAAGTQLVPIAERVEEEALAAERLFARRDFAIRGRVGMTVFAAGTPLIAPALVELRRAHPEIELHVAASNRTLSLRRRECDVAVRATARPSADLFGRSLGRLEFAVYGRAAVVEAPNPPWILWDESAGAEATWDLARRMSDPLRVAAVVDADALLLELACAGAGVALLPVPVAESRPELVPLGPVPCPGMGMDVWVLTHPDLRRAARVRTVMRFLGEWAPALLG